MISNINDLREILNSDRVLSVDDSFHAAKLCVSRLRARDGEHEGRDMLIRVLEKSHKLPPETHGVWAGVIADSGLYPYASEEFNKHLGLRDTLLYEAHRSNNLNGIVFHSVQREISDKLLGGESVVLAAPTSFGKSLLIDELVASRIYKNICVVQPTLALIDETRKRLSRYTDYNLIMSTRQEPSSSANIFLFTGERVVEYKHFAESVDFFVIDEFYKLSLARDDERSVILNQAFYKLLRMTGRFYLLGPSVGDVSSSLPRLTKAEFIKSEFATVSVDKERVQAPPRRRGQEDTRELILYSLLARQIEPTLVYCATPDRAERLAEGYRKYLDDSSASISDTLRSVIEWVATNIHGKWSLVQCLAHGIAFHHGRMPRHLTSEIVDLFELGEVSTLFCTSTLIEGVNTCAKNVVLYDKKKGRHDIDYFDYRNIAGRSGRMKRHFVGRVYEFDDQPRQEELVVEVPLFEHGSAPLELLVQMEEKDIDKAGMARLQDFKSLPEDLQSVIRQNSGVSVAGQIAFYHELSGIPPADAVAFNWRQYPTYPQLYSVLDLCWRHFLSNQQKLDGIGSSKQLAFMTIAYSSNKSVNRLINVEMNNEFWMSKAPDEYKRVQLVVQQVLQVTRSWFDFRLPRWLVAASRLQELVLRRRGLSVGNYAYYATHIEHSFVDGVFTVMNDYDIPRSAIVKLQSRIGSDMQWRDLVRLLRRSDLADFSLTDYEKRKVLAVFSAAQG